MKHQALFSLKDKRKEKLKCNLLQFLFGTLTRGSNGYARIDVRFPDKNDKLVQTR